MSEFIFTKHALQRLKERSISLEAAESVLRNPEETEPGSKEDTVKFIRTLHDRNIQLVGKYLPDQNKWLILSAWVRGEDDQAPLSWRVLVEIFQFISKLIKEVVKRFRR